MFLVALFSGWVFAQEGGEGFQKHKAEMIGHLDGRISDLTEAKTCVQSATTPAALQECRKKLRAEHKELRTERKEMRKARIDTQMKKLQERRKQLDDPPGN